MLILSLTSLLIFLGLLLPVFIVAPLYGALVRLRADYRPKGLQLDTSDEEGATTSKRRSTGYWAMLRLTYKVEGLRGLYKGSVPFLLHMAIYSTYAILFFSDKDLRTKHGMYRIYEPGWILSIVHTATLTLITLWFVVLTYRSIVTPYQLTWYNPRRNLRVLLSPTERRRPWLLLLLPGLLITSALISTFTLIRISYLRGLFMSLFIPKYFSPLRVISGAMVWLGCTVLLAALDVMVVRLAIQKHHGQAMGGYEYVIPEAGAGSEVADEEPPAYYDGREEVIELRSQEMHGPYTSIWDCAIKMVKEEGYMVLGRGAWATVLGGMAGLIYTL